MLDEDKIGAIQSSQEKKNVIRKNLKTGITWLLQIHMVHIRLIPRDILNNKAARL